MTVYVLEEEGGSYIEGVFLNLDDLRNYCKEHGIKEGNRGVTYYKECYYETTNYKTDWFEDTLGVRKYETEDYLV